MRTTHTQTDAPVTSRPRFAYKPDRHYVLAETAHGDWEGETLEKLIDMVDPETGDAAYTIEATGDTVDGKRATGHRKKVLLSCSKEFNERDQARISRESQETAKTINVDSRSQIEQFGHADSLDPRFVRGLITGA